MKRITIEELHLLNFRGARDVRVSFTAGTNVVCGDNGTGKSTLMDAFLWVLFGKDADDRKDCEIKRIEAGKMLRRTDATVECRLNVDGRLHTLRRSLREVWSKPRGATEPVFKGNETEYTINDVPKKMSEFDAWVAEHLAPADVFRLLTDAGCFPRLKWEKQREKLFELAGGVDEEAVKSSVDGLGDLLARLSGKSLEDYKRELAARKRKLRKALEEIPARSDQTRLMIPTTDARDVWERKLADVDARLAALNREAADFAAEERARGAEARRRVEEVEALKTRMARRTAELRRAAIEEAEKKNEGHRQVEARLQPSRQQTPRRRVDSKTPKGRWTSWPYGSTRRRPNASACAPRGTPKAPGPTRATTCARTAFSRCRKRCSETIAGASRSRKTSASARSRPTATGRRRRSPGWRRR